MNNNIKLNVPQENSEISLWEIADFLRYGWRWLVSGMVAGLIGGLGFLLMSPARYEVVAIVSPAKVGILNAGKGSEIEPLTLTIERLKLPVFYDEALVRVCQATSNFALASSFNASQVKSNALLRLSYRAPSVKVGYDCLNAVVDKMIRHQATLMEPYIKLMKEQEAMTQKSLAKAESFQVQTETDIMSSANYNSVLAGHNALSNYQQIAELRKLLIEHKLLLSESMTKPMLLLEQIYVSDQMVATRHLTALAGGLFGGLLFGLVTLFIRQSWLVYKVGNGMVN